MTLWFVYPGEVTDSIVVVDIVAPIWEVISYEPGDNTEKIDAIEDMSGCQLIDPK